MAEVGQNILSHSRIGDGEMGGHVRLIFMATRLFLSNAHVTIHDKTSKTIINIYKEIVSSC